MNGQRDTLDAAYVFAEVAKNLRKLFRNGISNRVRNVYCRRARFYGCLNNFGEKLQLSA